MGSGPGSLVFTALLWPKVAATEKAGAFLEAPEREIFFLLKQIFEGL